MAVISDEGPADSLHETALTLAGWRRFVDAEAPSFDLIPEQQWTALTETDRAAYDDARISYHSEMVTVATPLVRDVIRQGRLLMMLNRRERSARRGMIVSGPWTTGKSTALKELGRTHELMIRSRYPDQDRIPVVYVTTPPKGSPKKLAAEFARFLGLPGIKPRWNATDITDAVCKVLTDARCDLVLVDEIHNLNLSTTAGEDMSDNLKYLTEHIPATFVYAGIDVERIGLFTGVRGRQIAGRSILVNSGPLPDRATWRGLVAELESALRLHQHRPDTLLTLEKYLHRRTGGMIGSLSHLIRAAALLAIAEGQERIDRKLLETVTIDYAATSGGQGAAA